ncbi:MAG: hypothetical protein ACE5FI_18405, partial [Anaerolineales bacterium]
LWRELRSPHPRRVTRWTAAAAGFVAGSWPWWQATLLGGANTVAELSGAHVLSEASGLLIRLLNLGVFYPTALIGLRPPWGVTLLALPLAPVALIVFLGTLAHTALRLRAPATVESRAGQLLLLGVCATTLAGLIVTPFGGDPSGRYVLPLAAPLALFTADMLARLRRRNALVAHVGLGTLLVFNLWGNVESARANPPGITTQFDAVAQIDKSYDDALMRFLLDNGETRGYGNYWVGFPLAFLSDEALIFSAQLPYHPDFRYTPRDDRYAPYTTAVAQSERVAYITTHHPALNDEIRVGLHALGVTFEERQIGDYHVFYHLSRAVRPSELGLGEHAIGSSANE